MNKLATFLGYALLVFILMILTALFPDYILILSLGIVLGSIGENYKFWN